MSAMNPGTSTIHDEVSALSEAGDSIRAEAGRRRGHIGGWLATSSRAFADGFLGGLLGGAIYCVAVACLQPGGLKLAALRVLAVSLTFAGFEVWRMQRPRTFKDLRRALIWTFLTSLVVFWALGLVAPAPEVIHAAPQPYIDYGFFVRFI
jgi:hypothetical protein